MRQIIYTVYPKDRDGNEMKGCGEQKQGGFVAYTPDYKFAVIETTYGEIKHILVDRIRFLHPQEEE